MRTNKRLASSIMRLLACQIAGHTCVLLLVSVGGTPATLQAYPPPGNNGPVAEDEPIRDRVITALRQYGASPRTIDCSFVWEETGLTPASEPLVISEESVFFKQHVSWLSSGPFWKAHLYDQMFPPQREQTENYYSVWWDGCTFYKATTTANGKVICQLFTEPHSGFRYDVLDLMHRRHGRSGRSVAGRQPISEVILQGALLRQINREDRLEEYLFANSEGTKRLRVVLDPTAPLELSLLEAQWPEDVEEGRWLLEMSVMFRVESWMEYEGVSLPKVAYRRAFRTADDPSEVDAGGLARFTRTEIRSVSSEQLPREEFRPQFEEGWVILDNRLQLRYVIGEPEIEIDNVTYRTREPMHPELVSRLEAIVVAE